MKKILFFTALLPLLVGALLSDSIQTVSKPLPKTAFVIYDTTYKKVENYEIRIVKLRAAKNVKLCQ